jgi:hypothetical protein
MALLFIRGSVTYMRHSIQQLKWMISFMDRTSYLTTATLILLLLSACGGSNNNNNSNTTLDPEPDSEPETETETYTIGGVVYGLGRSDLILQLNETHDLSITSNGNFSFAEQWPAQTEYRVRISKQPDNQICTIENSNGQTSSTDIDDIQVTCNFESVTLNISGGDIKTLHLAWNDVDAEYYRILSNPDAISGYTQLGVNLTTTSVDQTIAVHQTDWANATYMVQACASDDICADSQPVSISEFMLDSIGFFKPSSLDVTDGYGYSVAISGDGNTLAVGTDYCNATTNCPVYIYSNEEDGWRQQARITLPETADYSSFGEDLTLSEDGNTLAIGAPRADRSAVSLEGQASEVELENAGAVYIYTRTEGNWQINAYLSASNRDQDDLFGSHLRLSADGNYLAVTASGESSNADGINGDQSDNTEPRAGAVYLFERIGDSWQQQSYIKASNSQNYDGFGEALAISERGETLAVGASGEDSRLQRVYSEDDNSLIESGAVYIFTRDTEQWSQRRLIKASNADRNDRFGSGLSLSSDGSVLAIWARGIDHTGAVHIYQHTNDHWIEQANIKASDYSLTDVSSGLSFDAIIDLSANGDMLAVNSTADSTSSAGVNGDASEGVEELSGAAFLFKYREGSWQQTAYIKAPVPDAGVTEECVIHPCPIMAPLGDHFGYDLDISSDGQVLAVGARYEDSAANGINGDRTDNSAINSGAVFLY